jgi:polyphenol oxidase
MTTTSTCPRSCADPREVVDVLVLPLSLDAGVEAWFTGRDAERPDPPVGRAGNLSHRRPHRPTDLARERAVAGEAMGLGFDRIHLMRQCHGAGVGVVESSTPPGAEFDGVDVLVTAEPDRPLAVATADCVPLLLAGARTVAAVHAGRLGVAADAPGAALRTMRELGDDPGGVHAVIGPAIGGCCYEVPEDLRCSFTAAHPQAAATTSWGTPALDLPAAVEHRLQEAGVADLRRVGGCTRCDEGHRWFSHRADPDAGRQLGVVVRRSAADRRPRAGAVAA